MIIHAAIVAGAAIVTHAAIAMVAMIVVVMAVLAAGTGLVAVRDLPRRCLRGQQLRPADHRHLLDREAEHRLQLVLHDLVVVELQVRRHQVRLRHTGQQQALPGRLHRQQQAVVGILRRQPLPGAEIQEAQLHRGGVEILHHLVHAVFVAAHIDGIRLARADTQFPGQHAAGVLAQMLVLHDAQILDAQLVEGDALQHLDLRGPGPDIDDRHLARRGLAQDRVVDGHGAEIDRVGRRVEADDVGTARVDGMDRAGADHTAVTAPGIAAARVAAACLAAACLAAACLAFSGARIAAVVGRGQRLRQDGAGAVMLPGEIVDAERGQRHPDKGVALQHAGNPQHGIAVLLGQVEVGAVEPVEFEEIRCGVETGDGPGLAPGPGDGDAGHNRLLPCERITFICNRPASTLWRGHIRNAIDQDEPWANEVFIQYSFKRR